MVQSINLAFHIGRYTISPATYGFLEADNKIIIVNIKYKRHIKIKLINIKKDYKKAGAFEGYHHIRYLSKVLWLEAMEGRLYFMGFIQALINWASFSL